MRLAPNDQLLNTLLSASHVVLQLSTREGFEVKVSEALHKGKPVIATNTGGIPLQIQDGKNGFLVPPGDWHAVAAHLVQLWTDDALYERMSNYAKVSVSDEVGTVGNARARRLEFPMWRVRTNYPVAARLLRSDGLISAFRVRRWFGLVKNREISRMKCERYLYFRKEMASI